MRKHTRFDPQVGQALLSPALEVAVTHLSPDKVILRFLTLSLFTAHPIIAQLYLNLHFEEN